MAYTEGLARRASWLQFGFIVSVLLLLVVPGSKYLTLSGIPLNDNLIEMLGFFFYVGMAAAFFPRKEAAAFSIPRGAAIGFIGINLVLCFFKFSSFLTLPVPTSYFEAKYYALTSPKPEGKAEFNPELYFLNRDVTRYESGIDYDHQWNLGFWHDQRSSLLQYNPENPRRKSFPFRAEWSGVVQLAKADRLEVEYTGEVSLRIDGVKFALPTSYGAKATHSIALDAISADDVGQRVAVDYRFSDGTKIGDDKEAWPGPVLRIHRRSADGAIAPLTPVVMKSTSLDLLNSVTVASFAFGTLLLLLSFVKGVKLNRVLSDPNALYGFAYMAISIAFVIGGVLLYRYLEHNRGFGFYVVGRSPGDDSLVFESYARNMLESRSLLFFLRSPEDVYIYQPFFRYVLTLSMLVFGEASSFQALFVVFLGALLFAPMAKVFNTRYAFGPSLLASGTFLFFFLPRLYENARFGISEEFAWLCVFASLPLLFAESHTNKNRVAAAVLLGLSAFTRCNFLIGSFTVLVAGLLQDFNYSGKFRVERRVVLPILTFGLVFSLVPLHNLVFSKRFVLTTDLAFSNFNTRSVTFGTIFSRTNLLFPATYGYAMAAVLFVLLLFAKIRGSEPLHKKAKDLSIMAIPLAFILPHYYWQADSYYPRFIVAGNISIVFCLLYFAHEVRDIVGMPIKFFKRLAVRPADEQSGTFS